MVGKIKAVFNTKTFRQSGITFSGTFINGLLGALFYILAARYLGPSSFGILTIAITTLTLVGDIGDLGTDTGLVRFVSKYKFKSKFKTNKFLKLALEVKLVVSVMVVVLGFILASFLANSVFGKPELVFPLKLASFGVGTYLLFSYITHALQGFEKFWHWSGIQVLTNLMRVVLIYLIIQLTILGVDNTLIIYILMPLFGFIIGFLFLPRGLLKVENETSIAKEFFHYNKWVAAFTLVAAISSRLDTFISARLLTSTEVGLYGVATQLTQIVPQLVGAIGTVVAPKMASMGDIRELVKYLKKTQVMVLAIAGAGLVSIPIVSFLIPILYGADYTASIPIFIILLFAMLIFLISVPVHNSVFYYFSYPKLFFWLALIHMGVIGGIGWSMISVYGAIGAAITVLIGQVVNFVIPAVWVVRKIKNGKTV